MRMRPCHAPTIARHHYSSSSDLNPIEYVQMTGRYPVIGIRRSGRFSQAVSRTFRQSVDIYRPGLNKLHLSPKPPVLLQQRLLSLLQSLSISISSSPSLCDLRFRSHGHRSFSSAHLPAALRASPRASHRAGNLVRCSRCVLRCVLRGCGFRVTEHHRPAG